MKSQSAKNATVQTIFLLNAGHLLSFERRWLLLALSSAAFPTFFSSDPLIHCSAACFRSFIASRGDQVFFLSFSSAFLLLFFCGYRSLSVVGAPAGAAAAAAAAPRPRPRPRATSTVRPPRPPRFMLLRALRAGDARDTGQRCSGSAHAWGCPLAGPHTHTRTQGVLTGQWLWPCFLDSDQLENLPLAAGANVTSRLEAVRRASRGQCNSPGQPPRRQAGRPRRMTCAAQLEPGRYF